MLRRFWLAAVAMVALFAARGNAADPKYLPGDTEIVFTINVKQILGSELIKSQKDRLEQVKQLIQSQLPGDNQAKEYLEKMGFDPYRDLTSITVGMPPTKETDAAVVLIEGKFEGDKLMTTAEQAARDHGEVIKIRKAGRFKIFEITPPGEKRLYASLIAGDTLVACASEETINSIVARAIGTKQTPLKKELLALLQTTSSKQSLNFVATGNAIVKLAEGAPVPNQQALQAIQAVEGFSGAVTIGKDVQLQLGVLAKDAAAAKAFADQANAGLPVVRFLVAQQAQQDERLAPLVDAVKTLRASAQGSNLILRGELSVENIQKLLQSFAPGN